MEFTTIGTASRLTGLSYLGSINSSAKIKKNKKIGMYTYVLYLAPHTLSGNNVCSMASQSCIDSCLFYSGRAGMSNVIIPSRITKTKLFFSDRQFFNDWVIAEIERAQSKAKKDGFDFSVRLNGTSDLSPKMFRNDQGNVLEIFKDVPFYDYTKVSNRFKLLEKYPNYDLTFSFSGGNWNECERLAGEGQKVAIVFNIPKNRPLPETHKGFNIIDGDINDYRPNNDGKSLIGLRWKNIFGRGIKYNRHMKQTADFVIQI